MATKKKTSTEPKAPRKPRSEAEVGATEIVKLDETMLRKRASSSRFDYLLPSLEKVKPPHALKVDCPSDLKWQSFRSNLNAYIKRKELEEKTGFIYTIRAGEGNFVLVIPLKPE